MKRKSENRGYMNRLFALLLCVLLFAAIPAQALAENAGSAAPAAEMRTDASVDGGASAKDGGIIDADKLREMTDAFLSERNIDPKDFSLGYVYTATGDEWYYNGDEWFYPASMYKVPLMMLLSEKVRSGEITQDTYIYDRTVREIEEYILVYSNNEWAHHIRTYLGGDEVWRQDAKKYAPLKDEEYDPDYMDYCYFNNRYMTGVMKTLYSSPESFPNITDCLLRAEPTHYFRLSSSIEGVYDVAQKYGSFDDELNHSFNHTTGIVYTPNPCIITVMTCNVSNYEKVISDAAVMLTEYTLELDGRLQAYKDEQAAAAEAERQAAEKAAAEKAEAERQAAEKAAAEKAEAERQAAVQKRQESVKKALKIAALVVIAVIAVFVLIQTVKRRFAAPQRGARPRREAQRDYQGAPGRRGGAAYDGRSTPVGREAYGGDEPEFEDGEDERMASGRRTPDGYAQRSGRGTPAARREEKPRRKKLKIGNNYEPKH